MNITYDFRDDIYLKFLIDFTGKSIFINGSFRKI